MHKLSVQDLDLKDQRIFLRADLNVPQNDDLSVRDDTRIRALIPTIEYIINQGGKVIIASHLGRPKGRDQRYSLAPIAQHLGQLLSRPIAFAPDCIGHEVKKMVAQMNTGDILMLENLRFHPEEKKPDEDPSFAAKLADLADCYVDDAFGCAHRAHASIVGVPHCFAEKSAAGFLLEREATFLTSVFNAPKTPFYVVSGGAKVSSKLDVLNALLDNVTGYFVGGGMVFTFLKAMGIPIGDSLVDDEQLDNAKKLLRACEERKIPFHVPNDVVVTNGSEVLTVETKNGIKEGFKGVDIGAKTVEEWTKALNDGALVFWNGPMGIFEESPFDQGTYAIAKAIANLKAITIAGGGDSIAAIQHIGVKERFTHISTGGGATLEFIEKGQLPGIEALTNI